VKQGTQNAFGESVEQCAKRLLRSYHTYKKAIAMAKSARKGQRDEFRVFYSNVITHLKAKQR
jgi:hypothetical protein